MTPEGTSQLDVGVTHTQYSLDPWGDASAVANGKALLRASTRFQNQHIMGWGAENPEPSPGAYDWASLDRRIKLIRATGATPVITLCCAPDWMKGGTAGRTDWSKLTVAPTPDHYGDYANLCKQVALRYPDVHYFQVWNELKGFYNSTLNRWDYEGYTQFYNLIYDALKSVNPNNQVGGPYVVMDSWTDPSAGGWPAIDPSLYKQPWGTMDQRSLDVIRYWLAHKHGADFIDVDASDGNRDTPQGTPDPFVANQKFVATMNWIRRQSNGGATLPIWWAEWYASAPDGASLAYHTAVMADGLIQTLRGGANEVLLWQPQGDTMGASFPVGVFNSTTVAGGGQATVYYPVQKALHDYFSPGTPLYKATSSSPIVDVLASATKLLLVNKLDTPLTVNVNGTVIAMAGYEVLLL